MKKNVIKETNDIKDKFGKKLKKEFFSYDEDKKTAANRGFGVQNKYYFLASAAGAAGAAGGGALRWNAGLS